MSAESPIQRDILRALDKCGIRAIRVTVGAARSLYSGGRMQLAKTGTPDILVLWPYLWIEVKDDSILNPKQREWHAWAKRTGIPVAVAHSVGEALKAVVAEKQKKEMAV